MGRTAFLGQLYSAVTDNTFNIGLFPEDVSSGDNVITTPMPRTDVTIKVVKNSKERANLLDISAKVSLSICGGALEIKGFGNYVDSSDTAEESTTISGVVRCRTIHQRLDLGDRGLLHSAVISNDRLKTIGATHVVTAITYGGTLVANLSESKSQSKSNTHIKGDFSLSVMKSFGALAEASGSASLTEDEKKALKTSSFSTRLIADYVDFNETMPVTPDDMLKTLERGLPGYTSETVLNEKQTHGKPVDLVLTPLTYFSQVSTEIIYRELAQTDLEELRDFYEDLSLLRQRRTSLLVEVRDGKAIVSGESNSAVAIPYKDLFPSLYQICTTRFEAVQNLHLSTRTRLGRFLKEYRSQTQASETVAQWMQDGRKEFKTEMGLLDRDAAAWTNLSQLIRTSATNGCPLTTLEHITAQMNHGAEDSIVLFLIPENPKVSSLLEAFRDSSKDIRKWRDDQNAAVTSTGATTEYLSFYADALLDQRLLRLETTEGSFAHALATARRTAAPACMMFAFREDRNGSSWISLNQEHWGSFISVETKTRYIGFIKNGVPHGTGIMAYVNGLSYNGDWCLGRRDGNGILTRNSGAYPLSQENGIEGTNPDDKIRILHEGLWFEDKIAGWSMHDPVVQVTNAVPVEVTVYHNAESIATAIFCVQNGPGPHTQLDKIARVFGWRPNDRYRLTPYLSEGAIGMVQSDFSVVARGSQIELGPYADASTRDDWNWPDDFVTVNGKTMSLSDWSRHLRPFPPVMGPDVNAPTKFVLQSKRTRPIRIKAVLLP